MCVCVCVCVCGNGWALSSSAGDSAVVQLSAALEVNTGLEMLLIADNPFGDEGGQQLTSVLCRVNRNLRILDIHGTHMNKAVEREVQPTALQVVTSLLPSSPTQVVQDLHQFSSLVKLGSAFGGKTSQHTTEMEGIWH